MRGYLTCPGCHFTDDICSFPDLYCEDIDNTKAINNQVKLQRELLNLGYNIVTCGNCGQVFIYKIK